MQLEWNCTNRDMDGKTREDERFTVAVRLGNSETKVLFFSIEVE